jgi:hypothetical protein
VSSLKAFKGKSGQSEFEGFGKHFYVISGFSKETPKHNADAKKRCVLWLNPSKNRIQRVYR